MNKIIAVFVLLLSVSNVNAGCFDFDLKDKAFKLDLVWNYAPGYHPVIEQDIIFVNGEGSSPSLFTIEFKNYPYKIDALIQVMKPTIADEEKIFLVKFFGENTDTGRKKETKRLVQIKKGKAKAKFYAPLSGIAVSLVLKDISLDEWIDLEACPSAADKVINN